MSRQKIASIIATFLYKGENKTEQNKRGVKGLWMTLFYIYKYITDSHLNSPNKTYGRNKTR